MGIPMYPDGEGYELYQLRKYRKRWWIILLIGIVLSIPIGLFIFTLF